MIIGHLPFFFCELPIHFLPNFQLGYSLEQVWICKYSLRIVIFCLLFMLQIYFPGSLFLFLPLHIIFVKEVLSIYVIKSTLISLYLHSLFQWMKE